MTNFNKIIQFFDNDKQINGKQIISIEIIRNLRNVRQNLRILRKKKTTKQNKANHLHCWHCSCFEIWSCHRVVSLFCFIIIGKPKVTKRMSIWGGALLEKTISRAKDLSWEVNNDLFRTGIALLVVGKLVSESSKLISIAWDRY
jgi:hypothetical protein